ncbi:hypothetical protein V1633_03500 [Plantactinospora sonchi]|uniref:Uncharacterized protein n=1 Tax=Plantactinospora sonchi TaxID=1544735 RepID=A0ABU7RM54_9ACTN
MSRIRAFYAAIGRVTLTPLLVRGGVLLCALLALLLAYPAQMVDSRAVGLLAVLAAFPAVAPNRAWPTVVILAAVAGWTVATGWYDQRIELWRLLGLATFLYLTHSLAALAALLSYDAVVAPEVLTRWITRALGVTLASAVLAVPLLALDGQLGDRSLVAALIGGLAVAVLAAALLGWLLRRR